MSDETATREITQSPDFVRYHTLYTDTGVIELTILLINIVRAASHSHERVAVPPEGRSRILYLALGPLVERPNASFWAMPILAGVLARWTLHAWVTKDTSLFVLAHVLRVTERLWRAV